MSDPESLAGFDVGQAAEPDGPSVGEHVHALLEGDFARGLAGFSEDIVWHIAGPRTLRGEHQGREAMLALLERLFAARPSVSQLVTRWAAAHGAYRFEWVEARHAGEARAWAVVSRLDGGRIREVWWCMR